MTTQKTIVLLAIFLALVAPARAQTASDVPCSAWVGELDDAQVEDLWLNGFVEGMLAGYEAGTQLVRVIGHIEEGPGGRWEDPMRADELKIALKQECSAYPSESIVHAALVAGLSIVKGQAAASQMRQGLQEAKARRLGDT